MLSTQRLVLLGRLSVAAALLVPAISFTLLFPLVVNLPTWDQWSMVEVFQAHYSGQPTLPLLLRPYNGHLNVLPRLFFYVVGLLSHWDVRVEAIASYMVATATLVLFLLLLRRQGYAGLLLALPVACQAFSLLQYENFMSGYPFGQNFSHFLGILAIVLLTRERLRRGKLVAAGLAAAGSMLSWGAGLATWYAGLAALVLRGERSWLRLGAWAGVAAAATVGVRQVAGGSFGVIRWVDVPSFFLALLGRPLDPRPTATFERCTALGLVALAVFLGLGVIAFWRRRAAALPWVIVGLNALASVALIAVGRSPAGPTQALASHYVTTAYPVVVASLALLGVLAGTAPKVTVRRWLAALTTAVALATLALTAAAAKWWVPVLRSWDPIVRGHALAIVRGTATDQEIRASHHPNPRLVRQGTEVLRTHRLAMFRQLIDGGVPAGNVDRLANAVPGPDAIAVDAEAAWTVEGWAVRSRSEGGPVRAVRLFVDGRLAGSATLDLRRTDVAEFFHDDDFLASGWIISVPGGLAAGKHNVWIAAADYDNGLHILQQQEVELSGAAASPGLARDRHELGAGASQ